MHGFKKLLKKILLVLAFCVVLLASVLIINTVRFTSKQIQVEPIHPFSVDENNVALRLAHALRFQTVSQDIRGEEFLAFHRYLEQTFPKAHSTLTRELVGEYSLLYTWKGRDESLKPILLMAHQDVMPVEPETLARWEQPPFEGRITDGYIWGRGAMDDKCTVLGIMEAVEMLSGQGLQPQRTIYLAFGHDAEVGGYGGAAKIAGLLRERNVEFEYVLDEGSPITDGLFPGVSEPRCANRNRGQGLLELGTQRRGRERSFLHAPAADGNRRPERGCQQARGAPDAAEHRWGAAPNARIRRAGDAVRQEAGAG